MLLENRNSFVINKLKMTKLLGQDYITAPAVLMVPGEFAGSLGKMKYTKGELEIAPEQWNMKPVVLNHPPKGITTTAYLNKNGLGVLWNVRYQSGKLKADICLLPDAIDKKASWLREKIENQIPVPISTGLFCEQETINGKIECTNIRPEHLAILEDEAPAFPIQDGVGLNMNKAQVQQNSRSTVFTEMTDADKTLLAEAATLAQRQEDMLLELDILGELLPDSRVPQVIEIKKKVETLYEKLSTRFQYLVQQIKPLSNQDVISDVIRYNINEYVYQSKYGEDFGLEQATAILETLKSMIKNRTTKALNKWNEVEHVRNINGMVDFGDDKHNPDEPKHSKHRKTARNRRNKAINKVSPLVNSIFRPALKTHYKRELTALHTEHNFETLKGLSPNRVIKRVCNWAKQNNFGDLYYDTDAQQAIAKDLRKHFTPDTDTAKRKFLRAKHRLQAQWNAEREELQNQIASLCKHFSKQGLPDMHNGAWENVKDSASTTVARQAKRAKQSKVKNHSTPDFKKRYGFDM
jgi:hypothetical protein